MFDSCWPQSWALSHGLDALLCGKHPLPPGDPTDGTEFLHAAPSRVSSLKIRTPKRGPLARAHFRKSLSSRHPQLDTHPAGFRDVGRVRGQICIQKEDFINVLSLKIKATDPDWRAGSSFPPGNYARGAGQKPRRGHGSKTYSSPGSLRAAGGDAGPLPPAPAAPAPRCVPHLCRPRRGPERGAGSPHLERFSLTEGSYLQPRALSAPSV
ncbi:hypothetical protein TREES_T100010607 [Tupaia chinensis]|uniref:Uncharacterized protein n=1 Tax=Tupaia chinensis TaxID=246437 RepID=L9L5I8_TUPCH|nr:hypothetical protein TREES_T100010607 [Tupaia chinensis]